LQRFWVFTKEIFMDEDTREHMEEIIRREAQRLISCLQRQFPNPPPRISKDVVVEWDPPENPNSCLATVATAHDPQLLIALWYDRTLDGRNLGLWVGFGAYDRERVEELLIACAPAFPAHQTVHSFAALRGIPLDDALAGPIAEFYRGGYNGFGIYGKPGNTTLDVPGAVNFIEQVLLCCPEDREQDLNDIRRGNDIDATAKKQLIDARRGQGKFRSDLERVWKNECAVLGCSTRAVLRASHIKPWGKSSDTERLDPNNGLLLAAHLDTLFDRYLITFANNRNIMISEGIGAHDRKQLGLDDKLKLRETRPEMEQYLVEHRAVFKARETARR
jgi:HNH endonuclease